MCAASLAACGTGNPQLWATGWISRGAISGLHWQEVAREHRTSLLLALEDAERRA
jgi:hypothetical protein